jgi:hypothetical protein
MWILPKQLHTSAFVQDTKALGLDSEEFSQTCEKSLSWRGKDSLSRTWLQRWKRENWIQHLSSRTLNNSHTESFVDKWTSYLADSRANPSVVQDSVKQLMIPDTCSHTSEMESGTANLELFSSKTLEESSQPRQGMENQFSNMSSENWKDWVTEQRQEYSQRKKSAHLIRESESLSLGWSTPIVGDAHLASNPEAAQKRLAEGKSTLSRQVEAKSWPTARTSDAEGGRIDTEMTDQGFKSKRHRSNQTFGAKLRDAVETHEENWATPIANDAKGSDYGYSSGKKVNYLGGQVKNWPTATTRDWKDTNATVPPSRANPSKQTLGQRVAYIGLQDQANLNTNGKSQESWPTPRANKVHPQITEENREHLANRKKSNLEEDIAGHCGKATGKLNPNWVEHLMGLPVGWTQLPTEWIDSDS